MNAVSYLSQLNGRTVDKVYQVDFNNDRFEDDCLPWLFYFTFSNWNYYLEIEGNLDGDHIKINLYPSATLEEKLKENDFPNEPLLWQPYVVDTSETLGQLLGKQISWIEYGIDKPEFYINGTRITGQQNLFTFLRLHFGNDFITIFEGGTGLWASADPEVEFSFRDTFDWYSTK